MLGKVVSVCVIPSTDRPTLPWVATAAESRQERVWFISEVHFSLAWASKLQVKTCGGQVHKASIVFVQILGKWEHSHRSFTSISFKPGSFIHVKKKKRSCGKVLILVMKFSWWHKSCSCQGRIIPRVSGVPALLGEERGDSREPPCSHQAATSCNAFVNSVFLGAGPGPFKSVNTVLLLFLGLSFDPRGFIFGHSHFPEQCPCPHDEGLCSTSFGSLKHGTLCRPKTFPGWLMATHLMQRVGLKLWIYWAEEQYISPSRVYLSYTTLA